jgi:predicted GTPase
MEMISAEDLFYLKKVENLEKEYRICANKIEELDAAWEEYLQFENFSVMELNIISSQKQHAYELMRAIQDEIERIKFEAMN